MNPASLVIVILNCRLPAPEGEIASGVVIIEDGVVAASGRDFLLALPPDAILIDAERGLVGMGKKDAEELGPIVIGAPADIVCRSRFGETVWAMEAGVIVAPGEGAHQAMIWKAWRERAIRRIMDILARREEHIEVTLVDSEASGEDIVWLFRDARDDVQRLTIRVVPSLLSEPRRIFFLDEASAGHLPEADVHSARAHWWFYLHAGDGACYCLPTRALQRWLRAHAADYPLTATLTPGAAQPLQGRAVPIDQLQAAIPRMRVLLL